MAPLWEVRLHVQVDDLPQRRIPETVARLPSKVGNSMETRMNAWSLAETQRHRVYLPFSAPLRLCERLNSNISDIANPERRRQRGHRVALRDELLRHEALVARLQDRFHNRGVLQLLG